MSDTLQIMEMVDSLAQVSDLEGACRVLTRSPALGRPFHQASLGLVDDRAMLSEIARFNLPGLPHELSELRVWEDTPLSRSLVRATPRVFSRTEFSGLHPDIRFDWQESTTLSLFVLPILERGVPYGMLMLFSDDHFETVDLDEGHRELIVGSLKMLLRQHEWRTGLAMGRTREAS